MGCFVRALEICPTYGLGWNNLGAAIGEGGEVDVMGTRYGAADCFVRALELVLPDKVNLSHTESAWANLGRTIPDGTTTVIVKGKPYTKQACYAEALNAQCEK